MDSITCQKPPSTSKIPCYFILESQVQRSESKNPRMFFAVFHFKRKEGIRYQNIFVDNFSQIGTLLATMLDFYFQGTDRPAKLSFYPGWLFFRWFKQIMRNSNGFGQIITNIIREYQLFLKCNSISCIKENNSFNHDSVVPMDMKQATIKKARFS